MSQDQLPLPMQLPHNLRSIEGGRAIAARDVLASFAVDTDSISTDCLEMAGFVVIAWDDVGAVTLAYHLGTRNPFSPCMIGDVVKNRLAYEMEKVADE